MMTVDTPQASAGAAAPPASVVQLETRFTIARDALVNERGHLDDALAQFLDTLVETLAGFRITSPDSAPLDARVLGALAKMKPCRDFFLELLNLGCESADSARLHERIRSFLGHALALKQPPRDLIHFNHLWCDHYRFFLRELFLGSVAVVLNARQYDEVARYLDQQYEVPGAGGSKQENFLRFDAYIKTLDEFRARRLRLNRLSVAADLLRERADRPFIDFDAIMQADFTLSVRGLLHHPRALNRWFPRTLVFAEGFEKSGFDLYFSAQSRKHFAAVCTVLGVRDKAELVERFERARRDCRLDQWSFGGCPINFDAYLGLAALDTA